MQQYVLDQSCSSDGLVLSGSGALDGLVRLAKSAPPGESNILDAAFAPARTPFDWLSRVTAVVDAFINDPLCFGALQPASSESFFAAASRLADPVSLRRMRPELPIYLFSGSEDPVGQRLEGVRTLIERYREAGIRDISWNFHEFGRHPMLNEINRDEVRTNLFGWFPFRIAPGGQARSGTIAVGLKELSRCDSEEAQASGNLAVLANLDRAGDPLWRVSGASSRPQPW